MDINKEIDKIYTRNWLRYKELNGDSVRYSVANV